MEKKSELAVWLQSPAGVKIPLGEKCTLGRATDCQVVVNSQSASRRHAMIYRQGDQEFWAADLGSANGTRVNGRHLSQHRRLTDGERLEVGGVEFLFRQPKASTETRTDTSAVFATALELRALNCWLLVADMIGSTEMVRRLSEDEAAKMTRNLLNEWKTIVESHQGTVNKFLGDGFLAYWPDAHGVASAVFKALGEFEKAQGQSQTPFRLVLHYGSATSGGAPSMGRKVSLEKKSISLFAWRTWLRRSAPACC